MLGAEGLIPPDTVAVQRDLSGLAMLSENQRKGIAVFLIYSTKHCIFLLPFSSTQAS